MIDPLGIDLRSPPLARRAVLSAAAGGLGALALDSLGHRATMAGAADASPAPSAAAWPGIIRPYHVPPKAKRVIWLYMAGGMSHLDTFDNKPKLAEMHGQPMPESFTAGQQLAQLQGNKLSCMAPQHAFRRVGQSGQEISEIFPEISARIADRIAIVRSMHTEAINHDPAHTFMNTGSMISGRPAAGSWLWYGLGTHAEDLPGFVVLQSGPRGPRGGAVLWGSGVLPSTYQGVSLRNQGDPIVNLSTPKEISPAQQRQVVDAVRDLHLKRLVETGDDEIATRINAYEMAYRMQTSAPELMDTAGESQATLDMYGIKDAKETSFARNCLLARRLVERGVRFVQLYDTNWDHHGGPTENLEKHMPLKCADIDQACAALVKDLKQRGLLDDTIVVWGGEFGRTPMGEVRESTGRNHHIDAFTMWFAGGGFKPGTIYGQTDEFGFGAVENPVHVHDIHATILHQLGLDHERLSVRSQGLDFRLTGVDPAKVIKPILA